MAKDHTIGLNKFEMTGADGSKIEGEKAENAGCGDRKNHIKIELSASETRGAMPDCHQTHED